MPKFAVGDRAVKPRGYAFDCTIVSVFENLSGEVRVVGETRDGLLHIFNESQLEVDARPQHETPTLVDRLRGVYTVPVNDGAGPLNGSDTFTRRFETPPIQHEAAARIEALEQRLRKAGVEP